jgi:hypothetical protein
MMNLSSPAMRFGGVTILQSADISKLKPAAEAQGLDNPISEGFGYRPAGPIHEFVGVSGKDVYAVFESMYKITVPDEIKALPPEEGFEKLETDKQYRQIVKQVDDYEIAMSRGDMFGIGSPLTIPTAYFQYLGYCQGKGTTADGTPVQVINLDA